MTGLRRAMEALLIIRESALLLITLGLLIIILLQRPTQALQQRVEK